MAKQYTVIVTSTQASDLRTHKVAQNSGDKGRALRIKAKAGETYQLVEMQAGQAHSYAPQNVKVKRVGNDLVITFEGGSRPDIVIEGYYDVMAKDHKGLIGEAEDGNLYEYIPEDPHPLGLVQMLPEGGQDVAMALGAGEIIAPAEAAIAAFPLLGLLGLGAAGAAAYVLNKDDNTTPTNGISGKLSDTSDLTDGGNKNDDITRDNTPTLTGTAPVGSTATVTINGQTYPVTVNPDGTWTFQQPTNLPDGTYYPILNVTQNGVTTKSNLTPFTIDTTPPSIAITSNAAALASGETATVTFTLSEAVADFAQGDVAVTGGTLSNFQQDPNNPLVYTATFTPASTGTSATISVANDKFSDAAGNLNTDGAEANNIVSLATNATVTGALTKTAPNDSGPLGDNITNDNTPTLKGKVPPGSTAKIIINGVEQPVQVDANGNWTYTVPNGLPDGTYTPQLIVTPQGSSTPNAPVPLTPFTIDTVPPSIVVSAPTNSLVAGQTTPITFTLSEPVADFTAADIAVTGGTLSNFVQSPTDPKIYTATFTPSTTGTSASITVPSGKFSDAAANFNTDGADTAPATTNTITLATNATASGGLAPVSDNSTGTPNDNTTNDATPELAGKVPVGSTAVIKIKDANGNVVGEGPATINPDGTWSFTQPNNLPDGTYSPEAIVNGGTPTPLKQFVIDTTPPAVAITAPVTTLAAGASTVVTFTVSEGTTDLTLADIAVTGGTLGTLQQSASNPLVYTATYTSTSGGTGAVSIASNRFSDAAGNLNKDTNENPAATGATYEANNTVGFNTGVNPTPGTTTGKLAPTSDSGVMGDNKTNDTTPELKGTVPPGSTAVIKIKNDQGVVVGEGPATVNPDGTWSFTQPNNLPDGVYTPEVIVNGGTPTPITPFVIDTTPPTIFIQADKTQLLAGQTTTVTFTLSEAVTDFAWNATTQTGDITVSGGTLGALTHVGVNAQGKDVYTATFTPTAGSTATSVIAVGNGNFSDAANNFNTDGADTDVLTNTNTLSIPTNTVVGGGTGFLSPNSDSGTPGDNITNDDTPTITGQVPPGSTASVNINGKDYPVTVNPDGTYSYTIPDSLPDGTYVPKIKVTPPGGGTPIVSDGIPFTIDTTPPTVLVQSDKTSLSTGQTATITFTLSEDSKDFTLADVTTEGGTLSNLQGSGKTYTATFTPTANSTALSKVKVDSLKFSDAAGNFNQDGADTGVANTNVVNMTTNTTVPDTVRPTIAITADRATLATGQTTLVTFTLSEPSSNFNAASISVTGGTLGTLAQSTTNPLVYTAVFTPTANSTTTSVISVASNKFSDAAGNQNNDGADANNTVSLPTNTTPGLVTGGLDPKSDTGVPGDNKTLDNTPTISGTAPPGSDVEIRIPGQNGQPDTIVRGKADENGQYSINVPDALPDGTYTPEIRVTPPGGNTTSTDGTPFTIDTTPPTVLVTSSASTLSAGQTATITFTLSEASTDFTAADVAVTGGTLSNFQGSGTSYTATFTPNANSIDPSVVHVASAKFADAAGNANTDGTDANNTVSMVTNTLPPDTTAPTIVVARTNPTASLKHGDTETITFTLSEASTDFNVGDIDITGGTLSNFTAIPSSGTAATGYTQYTATFTPTDNQANGSATVGVAVGKFKDNAGNANQDDYNLSGAENENNRVTFTYNTTTPDTTPPTVALSRTGTGDLTLGGSEVINIVLSEASKNFDLSDIVVTGGTLSGFAPVTSSGNATTGYTDYVVTFTPNANTSGNATIGVAAGKFTDAANNQNLDTYSASADSVANHVIETNNIVSLGYNTTTPDTTPPTVAVSRSGLGTVSSTETIYFTLSEASTDFALDDVSVTGGQLSNFAPVASSGSPATGYTQYQVTFTPAANSSGLAAVGVVAGTFHDAAGNANKDTFESGVSGTVQEANNAVSFNVNTVLPDNTAPTVAVGRSGTGIVTGPETITFTLSEASTTFGAEDISVTGGTLSGFTPVATSGSAATGYTEYTATFTPAVGTSGSATVGVASDKFSDAAGNYNKDTFLAGVAGTTQEVNNSVSFNYNSVAPDTTPPTIAIERLGTGTLSANASETIRFTISEATKDFTLDDIVVLDASGNVITGALSNLAAVPTSGTVGTGYTTYVATFTALSSITPASGMVTIGVASTKFSDAAGYFNQDTYTNPATGTDVYEANNKVDISYNTLTPSNDTITPTVIVARAGSATLQTGGTETITFTLSEPSLTFDWSDITVTGGGTLGPLTMVTSSGTPATGYTVYTATYTPPANTNSTTTIGVLSDKFSDAAGNLNKDTYATGVAGTSFETNNVVSVAYNTTAADTTAPKVEVLRSASGTITGPETIYFNFSEAINPASFTTSDIVATGGTISNLVAVTGSNNTQFIATFTPNATSTGTATIGVGASAVTDVAGNANTDTITFTLSEASADFTQTDVTVTGGTLSNWTHSTTNPLVYTATFTPTPNNAGTALIGVRAGTFNDLGNNANADDYRLTGGTNGNAENDNNKVDIAFNTLGATFVVNNDTNTVNEDGSAVTGNVKTNDSLVANVTSVSQGSTSGTLGTALAGTYGSLTLNADGSYTYVIDNSKTAVQALKAGQTVTEVFSYTGSNTGATQSGSANLTITITGTNDAPVAVADTATALEAGGTANGTAGSNATGNVLTNDTDLDLADTKVVSAIHAGSATGTTGDSAVAAGTPTVKAGTYGSISINADGSYTYTITDQNNSDIQALRTSGQSVNDVFTYTVKDGSNATHQATITVNITGANDAPTVSTTVANKNGTVGTALADFVGPVFADVDTVANGETSTITATLANGQPLSSIGLSYDASTNTFSGTPTAAGTYTIVVKDTDAGGLSVQTTFDVVVAAAGTPDTTPPTIAITSDKTTLAAGQSATITFTLSEASTDFAWDEASQTGDITVTGGTLTNFQGSGTSYSATFTPDANSIADSVIHVASNKFSDAAATPNFNVDGADANNTVTMVTNTMPADTTAPTIVVARTNDGATLNTGATETITFTLSEASTDFTLDDITVSGGQLSNFAPVPTSGTAGTGYTQYVVTFTPTANSTTPGTVGVLSGKFSDNAGNLNQDTYVTSPTSPIFNDGNNQVTLTIDTTTANPVPDTTVPTVAVARAGSGSLATGGTDTITFTLSEASTTFTVDDVDVVGGSLSNFAPVVTTGSAAGGYTVYTATFTPTTGSGTATIGVVDGKFADAAGNTNKDTYAASPTAPIVNDGNNQVSIGYDTTAADTTAPTVVVSRAGTGTVSTSETVYFTLSEASTTFALGDVTVNGGTLSNFVPVLTSGSASAGYTQYTATFTPVTGSGTAFVGVASGTFSDTATTPNTNKDTYDVDATSPLVYEANNFVDLAYNTSATDSTKPTIAITSDKTTLTAGQTALITFTLSEASTNFVEGDVTVTGGTLSGWIAISPTEYIATFTPATNSTANSVIHVDSDKFSDAASNQNADGAEANNTVTMATDTTSAPVTDNPTIAITSSTSTLANGQTATITFTLSEASSDFTSADIDVVGGTLGALQTTDNITYTATFTPTDNAVTTATIGVKAGKFTATATTLANLDTYEPFVTGTVAELNNIVSMAVNTDNTPPTVAVSQLTSPVTGPTTVTFTLSEASSDFTAADVYVTPGAGSLDNWTKVSDTVYTARFNPTANSSGSVIIGVAAGTFKDAAGNNNADTYIAGTGYEANNKTDFTYNTDVTPPTIAITGPGGAINGPTTITFTLSEASSDFLLSEGDITVTGGGTLTNFAQSAGNPLVYTATYTPPATTTGAATINVASGAFSDAAGNFNADGGDLNNHLPVSYDTVTPTVVVTRATGFTLGGTGAPHTTELVTFTLSEASTDFTQSSVTTTGGSLSNWTPVSSTVYTATFTPTSGTAGVGTIGVQAGKFTDAAGNANQDTYLPGQGSNTQTDNQVSVDYDTQAPTQTVSFSSMTKDSGLSTGNANWTTADTSAGRLVSGFLSAPLGAGETVQVYSNGILIGTAVVNDTGTAWAITDTSGYSASWTYTAKVVDPAGNAGPVQTQVVNTDLTEAAPVITAVTDSTSASIANNGTTANTLGSVSGTGVEGDTIYLYDNTGTNLVGTTVVQAGGTWTVTGLNVGTGSNTFAAKQVDPLGNESVLSNLWTVTTTASTNLAINGDFASGNTGFTSDLTIVSTAAYADQASYWLTAGGAGYVSNSFAAHSSSLATDQVAKTGTVAATTKTSNISWSSDWGARAASTTMHANPDGAITGVAYWGGVVDTTATKIWGESLNVVAGQTYTFAFDYMDGFSKLQLVLDGTAINFTSKNTASFEEGGHFSATFTATTTGTIDFNINAFGRGSADGGADGNFVLDNFSFVQTAAPVDNSLTAGGTPPATPNPDNLTYTAGALDAEGSDDTITVASTSLQSILAAGGFIDGGAGIDTLKLAAGTTLNLEALTGNQTVQKIQEVEIFKLQGSSTLQMSANDVLSLGGANASTMAPFSFASTAQVNDGSTAPTGITSSTGKVQMVVQGTSTDVLKLDTLGADGITSSAGVAGNAGLSGVWSYMGTVQIGLVTYKVYDHSTTNAQVLVDVPVVVNTISPITIAHISQDTFSGGNLLAANDFVTSDNTLTYSGTVPVEFVDASHDVFVEILDSSNQVVRSGNATVTGTSWTWTDPGVGLADGNYTIRSTIVNQGTTTATTSFGANGVDTHPLTIDTQLPTIAITRATSNTLSAGQTETVTFTLSEAATDFDVNDVTVTGGSLINFSGSGTTYTATFVPTSGASGTGTVHVDNTKFSDLAGNFNADGAETNNTVSIAYQALPTQTVSFSSMTKDSSLTGANADWFTADGSAGRLVSGTISAPLTGDQRVAVYVNGSTLVGYATTVGQAWEVTDLNAYNANWVYTAKVVDAANNAGPATTQNVTTDFTEAAPVITSVTDSANASISSGGTTANTLSSVSGTGAAGDTVYLYDNTGTNLVGTTTVAANGTWTISVANAAGVGTGSNTFSARQVDALGNSSVLSNLWTVTSTNNMVSNGNFANQITAGETEAATINSTTALSGTGTSSVGVITITEFANNWAGSTAKTLTDTTPTNWAHGTSYAKSYTSSENMKVVGEATINALMAWDAANSSNKILAASLDGVTTEIAVWKQTVNVVAGATYTFSFDYAISQTQGYIGASIDGALAWSTTPPAVTAANGYYGSVGTAYVTYTADHTGPVTLKIVADNGSTTTASQNDLLLDDVSFVKNTPPSDNSLSTGTAPFTNNVDGTTTAITYTAGAADMLDGNDVLNIGTNAQTLLGTAGNFIDGSGGVDTLKLAAGTVLNLEALTSTQTVKTITQVEVVQMQSNSLLALSANDVLSLGGTNTGTSVAASSTASPMAPYSFATTSAGNGSNSGPGTTSQNKVQFVVQGTSSDTLVLNDLKLDGVTTNSTVGNTGLSGKWEEKGTVTLTGVDGVSHTYKVYNHSTTNAQVLVDSTMKVLVDDSTAITTTAAFSSMTKDSSLSGANADWTTNDGSAGRLVSGTLSANLGANEVVRVYANGTLIGEARVAGQAWEITDLNGYTGNWAYTAQVFNTSSSTGGAMTTQAVTTDFTEAAPFITSVTDSSSTSIANNGSTTNTLSTVSGTGNAGDTIYLYDNTGTNLVGTTTVTSNGTWSISGLATSTAVGSGSNTFSARQVDALGNSSVLSNLWTVSSLGGGNTVVNGDFSGGNTGFTTNNVPYTTTMNHFSSNMYALTTNVPTVTAVLGTHRAEVTTANTNLKWTTDYNATPMSTYSTTYSANPNFYSGNPNGKMSGTLLEVNLSSSGTFWQETMSVIAGKTYTFEFDYQMNGFGTVAPTLTFDGTAINFTTNGYETGHFKATYTATTTKNVILALSADNTANGTNNGDIKLDNFSFTPNTVAADGSLTAGGTSPFTLGVDGVSGTNNSAVLSYTGGVADMLAGDDVLNIGTNAQTLLGTAGNVINGSMGIDTLKLAANTTLNLVSLTNNQTVKSIQQVEVFELQGGSSLTLSANDVLSLGMANAFTSNGKVQFMVNGTASDTVSLQNLLSDGAGGNTGLTGMWASAGTATYGGNTYNLYNHDTTGAQVWVKNTGTTVTLSASPLVLDLNGDGVQTTSLADGVLFDLLANGTPQQTAWVDRHDGWLALDLNGDGTINSGAELLGTSTRLADGSLARDGWQALGQYDTNADGQIDLSDAVFNQLRVWVDADTDGTTDAGELQSLADVGVQSIALAHTATQTAQNGNILDGLATVQHTDGSTTQMTDAWLNVSQAPVLDLNAVIAAGDRSYGAVDMTDGTAQILQLNVSDVLVGAASGRDDGLHILQVHGDATDVVQLSQLFADGHTEGQWAAQGQVTQNGQTFNVYQYSGDASLQVLIDQHIAQSNVHLS